MIAIDDSTSNEGIEQERTETDVDALLNAEQSTGNAHLRFSSAVRSLFLQRKIEPGSVTMNGYFANEEENEEENKEDSPRRREDHSWIHRSRKLSSIVLKQSGDRQKRTFPALFHGQRLENGR
ncbi:hypothetical protein K0M31_001288 [Melipona bicolor]|uniref:Uncharacterized protein n=1 Tax=Melipona bicolor TaxID=60889 RepID=A0AA40GGE6_9HYME|nr:hypothetical protein K0M31_001288 [Melipona bicolor]